MLILYPVTLPKEFMISNSFLVEFLGCLHIGSCHLHIGIVWLLPSLFESLLFLALVLFLGLSHLCILWIIISMCSGKLWPCYLRHTDRSLKACSCASWWHRTPHEAVGNPKWLRAWRAPWVVLDLWHSATGQELGSPATMQTLMFCLTFLKRASVWLHFSQCLKTSFSRAQFSRNRTL
jgi:hypothetical protein